MRITKGLLREKHAINLCLYVTTGINLKIKDSRKEARFDKYYKKVLFYQTKSVPWLGNMA